MSAAPTTGRVLVVSGPGGVGKGTVVAALRQRRGDIAISVSATTRRPREDEQDGVHYHFVSHEKFQRMIDQDAFVEWADFNGNRYGTPWTSISGPVADGFAVVLEIDVQGAEQIREREAADGDLNATLVFLEPPSWEVLEQRLIGRGSEDEESLAARLAIGRQEMAAAPWFDHVITNDRVDAAVDALARILDDSALSSRSAKA